MSEQEYELVGEEYASDGLWCSVVICEGSLEECFDAMEDCVGEYRNMRVDKLGTDDEDLAQYMKEFII